MRASRRAGCELGRRPYDIKTTSSKRLVHAKDAIQGRRPRRANAPGKL